MCYKSDLKLEVDSVYGYGMFPGVVLTYPREECVREEQAREPEQVRDLLVHPPLEELQPEGTVKVDMKNTLQPSPLIGGGPDATLTSPTSY